MAVLLACKKQGVNSVGESNVICHKVGPDQMMGIMIIILKKKPFEVVGFIQWSTNGRNERSGATSILTQCPHCP